MADPTYELHQVLTNARDGSDSTMLFDTFASLAEAKKAAKSQLKNSRWAIFESKLVATSG